MGTNRHLVKRWILVGAMIISGGLGGAKADIYTFTYSGDGVSASGQIVTQLIGSTEVAQSISGQRNLSPITGIMGPADGSTYDRYGFLYDNILFPATQNYVDYYGLLFSVTDVTIGPVNVYSIGSNIYEYTYSQSYANGLGTPISLDIEPGSVTSPNAATPEPGFYGLLVISLAGLAFIRFSARS